MTRLVTDPVIDGILVLIRGVIYRLPSWITVRIASRLAADASADKAVEVTAGSATIVPAGLDWLQESLSRNMSSPLGRKVVSLLQVFPGEVGYRYRKFSDRVTAFGMQDTPSSRAAAIALGLFDLDLILLLFAALGEQYLGSFGKSVADLVEQHGVVVKVSPSQCNFTRLFYRTQLLLLAGILHVGRIACLSSQHGILPRFLYVAAVPFWNFALPVDSAIPQSCAQRVRTLASWDNVHVRDGLLRHCESGRLNLRVCNRFAFARFLSTCRSICRKGAMYIIRDPQDPSFSPVSVQKRSVD